MNVLKLKDIHYSVRPHFWSKSHHILKGVDLEVEEGSIFGFLGPNGAGKTTTIKTILGLVTPQKGQSTVLGGSIQDPLIRNKIGFTPEHPIFPDYLTCRELVQQHALLAGLTYRTARDVTAKVIDQVNLTHAADRKLRDYSKGMLQRTGLAQAIVGNPQFLILDEPMGGVDPVGRREIREIMLALRENGSTILFSTHILPDIETICDTVGILIDGVVRRCGPPDTLSSKSTESVEIIIITPSTPLTYEDFSFDITETPMGQFTKVNVEKIEYTDETIDRLRNKGAKIRKVNPIRPNLEDLFLEEFQTNSRVQESTNV